MALRVTDGDGPSDTAVRRVTARLRPLEITIPSPILFDVGSERVRRRASGSWRARRGGGGVLRPGIRRI